MSLSRRTVNVMIISVRERRSEIGLRPTLGATHGQIRAQFLSEAILLALIGGASGRHRLARDDRLRPHQALGGRDPDRGVGRRSRLGNSDRRHRWTNARDPRRPALTYGCFEDCMTDTRPYDPAGGALPDPIPDPLVDLLANRLRAIGDPTRIRMLDRLRHGPASV